MAKAKIQNKHSKSKSKSNSKSKPKPIDTKALNEIKQTIELQKKMATKMLEESEKRLVNTYLSRCLPDAEPLNNDDTEMYAENYTKDPINAATENALASVPVSWLAEKRAVIQQLDYAYSHLPEICPEPTQQAYSGRCWMFAALNTVRHHIIRNLNLNDRFELSESYLFFYDKLERSMHFLENMIKYRNKPTHTPLISDMISCPVSDGGTWTYFVNLIVKYGIVPKTVYGEVFNSLDSTEMNSILENKLRKFAVDIRNAGGHVSDTDLRNQVKTTCMSEIYTLLVKFMGIPPQQFNWNYHERGDTFESRRQRGTYMSIKDLTPLGFYTRFVDPYMNLQNKVLLKHDPRDHKPYYRTYSCENSGNMVGGKPEVSLNVPWDVLSKAAIDSIKDGQQVWVAIDIEKRMANEYGILSSEAFDYNTALNTNLDIDKAHALDIYESYPTHAMVIVGVDIKDDEPVKWKVENSWGESNGGPEPGYLMMTNEWFKKYGYEIVVDLDYLDQDSYNAWEKYEFNPVILPHNDAFALSLSKKCHCC